MATSVLLGSTMIVRLPPHLTEQYNLADPASPIEVGAERPAMVVGLTDHDDGQGETFQTADLIIFHRSEKTTFIQAAPFDALRGVEDSWPDEDDESQREETDTAIRESEGQSTRTMPPAGGTPQDGPANTSGGRQGARRTS